MKVYDLIYLVVGVDGFKIGVGRRSVVLIRGQKGKAFIYGLWSKIVINLLKWN